MKLFFLILFIFIAGLTLGIGLSRYYSPKQDSSLPVYANTPRQNAVHTPTAEARQVVAPEAETHENVNTNIPAFIYADLAAKGFYTEKMDELQWQQFKDILFATTIANFRLPDMKTVLEYVIEHNDKERLNAFLNQGVSLNTPSFLGRQPITYAAKHSSFDFFEHLIANGAELPVSNSAGRINDIVLAAHSNPSIEDREKILDYLQRASVKQPSDRDFFLNSVSDNTKQNSQQAYISRIDLTVEQQNDINILEHALKNGATEQLISQFSDEQLRVLVSGPGYNPLHALSVNRNIKEETIERFIKNGADINGRNQIGMTPLMYAINHNHKALARTLIAYGAEAAIKDNFGRTAMDSVLQPSPDKTAEDRMELMEIIKGKQ